MASLHHCAAPLVDAMIHVYEASRVELRAESHAHYIYSPRELSRWIRALYAALQRSGAGGDAEDGGATDGTRATPTPSLLVRLWAHEGLRLFHDRLVTQSERDWTLALVTATAERHFPGVGGAACAQPMLFTSWLPGGELVEADSTALAELLRQRAPAFEQEEVRNTPTHQHTIATDL
eukprot:2013402-Prymnesium_polylepis.1